MKNMTMKILSMLLAVIMLLSAIPVAFAAEKSLRDTYVEELARLLSYENNVYEPREFSDNVVGQAIEELHEKHGRSISFALSEKDWAGSNEDDVTAMIEGIREVNSMVEAKITSGEATVIIDCYAWGIVNTIFAAYYNDKISDEMAQHINNSDLSKEALADQDQLFELINTGTCTQADYDTLMSKTIYLHESIMKHIDGEHDFNEYISNNDATEEADGTKTATCDFCGVTDTVVDEGSKLKKEPVSFIEKIIEFLKNIFAKILALFA